MIKALGILLMSFLAYANNGHSEEGCWVCESKSSLLERAECLNEISREKLKKLSDSERLLTCAFNYWANRDGAVGHVVAQTFFQILKRRPELIIERFSKSPKDLAEWTELLPDTFEGMAGNTAASEKKYALKSLNAAKNRAKFKQVKASIEAGLNAIHIPSVIEKLE